MYDSPDLIVFGSYSHEARVSGTLLSIYFIPGCLWYTASFSIVAESQEFINISAFRGSFIDAYFNTHIMIKSQSLELFFKSMTMLNWPKIPFSHRSVPDYWQAQIDNPCCTTGNNLHGEIAYFQVCIKPFSTYLWHLYAHEYY